MSETIFDAAQRNIELIVELMDIVGVHDCEELVDKVRELQKPAQQSVQRTACDCGRTDGKHDLFCAVEIEKRDATRRR